MTIRASSGTPVHGASRAPRLLPLPLTLVVLIAAGCQPAPSQPDSPGAPSATGERKSVTAEVPGTVRYHDIEGGCWTIDLDQGRVQPIGLPKEFAREGLRVLVRLEPVPDAFTTCQVGPLSRVVTIRREP